MIPNYQEYMANIQRRIEIFNEKFHLDFDCTTVGTAMKKRLNPTQLNILTSMQQTLEETYPDRYDIQFKFQHITGQVVNEYGNNQVLYNEVFKGIKITYVYILIHFPDITIRNNKKMEMKLRDLVVRIPFKVLEEPNAGFLLERIEGTRLTVGVAEFQARYFHSHLTRIDLRESDARRSGTSHPGLFSIFCTGTGDINMLEAQLNYGYDPDLFRSYLFLLEPFLSWESLEGTPYIRMEEAVEKNYAIPNLTLLSAKNFFNSLRSNIARGSIKLDVDWQYYNSKYIIVDNQKFEDFLVSAVSHSRGGINLEDLLLFRDERGEYFQEKDIDDSAVERSLNKYLVFRNQKIPFLIEGEIKRSAEQAQRYFHPKIKQYVKSRLEYYANKQKVREAGIKKLNTVNNI